MDGIFVKRSLVAIQPKHLIVTGGESRTLFGEDRVVDETIRPISVIADECVVGSIPSTG
jgi:hypothetical protein